MAKDSHYKRASVPRTRYSHCDLVQCSLSANLIMALTLRQVCKETQKQLSKALFYFAAERKTGIAPTRKIVGLDKNALCKGSIVTVNWQGKKVQAEILALSGKFSFPAFCLEHDLSEI